jgi:hypothetical protein
MGGMGRGGWMGLLSPTVFTPLGDLTLHLMPGG